jgi:hypothetical protein
MPYISKAEREAELWMTRGDLVTHVQEATSSCFPLPDPYEQIGKAIEDGELPVVWDDVLKIFWKNGGSGVPVARRRLPRHLRADKPPRDAEFWQRREFNLEDPLKGQFDPADPDRVFVGWGDYDDNDPDDPRFRKPMFWRECVEKLWPTPKISNETKATNFLAEQLKARPNLRYVEARALCREKFELSERGLQGRVWRDARLAAGLPKRGKPGRPKKIVRVKPPH